jgi:2-(1,2-epoxy-1,2-dihydrophenyl)acetyl-CoA isomerase
MEATEWQTIRYVVEDGVATLTLNRPAQRNALDAVMRSELTAALGAARRDRGVYALVLAGAGGAFCAGGDIRGAEEGRNRMLDLHLWVEELINFDRPVIAAVDGPAFGAGFAIALAADFVLATPRARFCLSFLKLGLIPDCGVFYTLPRIVGVQRAKELAFSAREIGAEEASRLGIVSEIHDPETIAERARKIALSFTGASLTALSITKRAFNASFDSGLGALLEMEATGQGVARSSEYHRNAAAAFLNKEAPPFVWPK